METIRFKAFVLFFLISSGVFAQDTTSFYVSAHPDDWQLFMNPNAFHSVKNEDEKTVFIHTTAGEAGKGLSENYYAAREEGSLRGIRFMVNSYNFNGGGLDALKKDTVSINNHDILRVDYNGVIAYFLRLPDGNGQGGGYPVHEYKSLEKFINQEFEQLHTVDSTTIYTSVEDLEKTLVELVKIEAKENQTIHFHVAETDIDINPNDHSDHIHSSLLMQRVANHFEQITFFLYQEYYLQFLEDNVFTEDYLNVAGTWGATTSGISDFNHPSTWHDDHNQFVGRQYYRRILAKELQSF